MNDLLLLPGNHIHQRDWIREVQTAVGDLFNTCVVADYAHWDDPDAPNIQMEKELGRLSGLIGDKPAWVVLGKSAGVVLGILAAAQGIIQPKKAIFIGLPLRFAQQGGVPIEPLLDRFGAPVLFIQQKNDPVCSADDLRALLETCPNLDYSLVVIPGDNHHYTDLVQMHDLIADFLE